MSSVQPSRMDPWARSQGCPPKAEVRENPAFLGAVCETRHMCTHWPYRLLLAPFSLRTVKTRMVSIIHLHLIHAEIFDPFLFNPYGQHCFGLFFSLFPLFCWWHFESVSHFKEVSLSPTYLLWLLTQPSPFCSSLPKKNQLEILISPSSEGFLLHKAEKNKTEGKGARFFQPVPFTVHQFVTILMKSHRLLTVGNMKVAKLIP